MHFKSFYIINLNVTLVPDLYGLKHEICKIWPSFSLKKNEVTLTECGETAVSRAVDRCPDNCQAFHDEFLIHGGFMFVKLSSSHEKQFQKH